MWFQNHWLFIRFRSAGEVVYMAPITLNKGHLVNKAGIQVDVIPIRRSTSCSTVRVTEIRRTKSEMGYKANEEFEYDRWSLPDVSLSRNYRKGDIMNTVIKRNPSTFLFRCSSGKTSNNSVPCSLLSLEIYNSLKKSYDSIYRRPVTDAFMKWMSKSFLSINNIDRAESFVSATMFGTGQQVPDICTPQSGDIDSLPRFQQMSIKKESLLSNGALGKGVDKG